MPETRGSLRLADSARVEVLLDHLAAGVSGEVGTDTALIGIVRRGAPLARMLAERLARIGRPVEVAELKLKRYADNLELLHELPALDRESLGIDVVGRHLVLVDDVLYTGESLLRACCFLRGQGARRMQIAVLCARGELAMPVRPDFVGLTLEVGPRWIIDCRVPPYDTELAIDIDPRPDTA